MQKDGTRAGGFSLTRSADFVHGSREGWLRFCGDEGWISRRYKIRGLRRCWEYREANYFARCGYCSTMVANTAALMPLSRLQKRSGGLGRWPGWHAFPV